MLYPFTIGVASTLTINADKDEYTPLSMLSHTRSILVYCDMKELAGEVKFIIGV